MRVLAEHGWDVVGLEPFQDSRMGTWVRGVAEHLPFKAGSFSAITCILVLPNLSEPFAAVTEAFRVLRPKGRGVFVVFSDSPLNARIGITGQAYGSGPWLPNRHLYSPRRLRSQLERAGFRSVTLSRSDYLPWLFRAIPYRQRERFLSTLGRTEPRLIASPLGFLARKLVAIAVKT